MSNKGKPQMIYEHFRFRCTKTKDNTEYWSCIQCNAKAVTVNRTVAKHGVHDHAVNMADVNSAKFQNNLRKRARDEPLTSSKIIYNQEMTSAVQDGAVIASLPTFDSKRSSMLRNKRSKFFFIRII